MRIVKYLLILAVLVTACKAKKPIIDANAMAKDMSVKKVSKKHNSMFFNKTNADAKLKVNFNNGKINQSLSVSMKIIKDEVILLKGTKFITVFKAKITPTSVSYYSPFAKNYFEGDFSLLKELLGVEMNFKQIQNLFLGQALLDFKEEKQEMAIIDNEYVLSPEQQNELFDIFFHIDPAHFKLNKQYLVNEENKLRLDVNYNSYKVLDDELIPSKINVIAKGKKSNTKIDLVYRNIVFNTAIDTTFRIPKGYKEISI